MELTTKYNGEGVLIEKGITDNGLKQGPWEFYFDSGKVHKLVHYSNDIKHGLFKRWYPNGSLAVECYYSNNKLDGPWREFYEHGKIREIGEYVNNQYRPLDFWNNQGEHTLIKGTGTKIETFGHSDSDVFEQYFENGEFIRERKII